MKCPLFKNNFLYYSINLTYQRIQSKVFNYPKKYQNGYTYYIENHEPIIHNKISNYELILDALDIKLRGY